VLSKLGGGSSQNWSGIDATGLDEPIPGHFHATPDLRKPPFGITPSQKLRKRVSDSHSIPMLKLRALFGFIYLF